MVGETPAITTEPAGPTEYLRTAVRVWTTRTDGAAPTGEQKGRPHPPRPKRRYPTEALIFDTETETGPSQRLRFLVWRLYSDPAGTPAGHFCVEEGIAYPDDLPERDLDGFALLKAKAEALKADVAPGFGGAETEGGLMFKPLSWWLEKRLHRYGYRHRSHCYTVGFNLPFDLGRIASYWSPAAGEFRGGWSLGIWGSFDAEGKWKDTRYRQRLLMKSIDPRRTLFAWGSRKKSDEDLKGASARFIDLRTLTFALTNASYALEGACAAFGDDFEKHKVDYSRMNPELIEYALEDVRHTSLLYRNSLAELAKHEGVELPPHRLYSPATLGQRYLEAMGLSRPLLKFTELRPDQLGWDGPAGHDQPRSKLGNGAGIGEDMLGFAMSAFYGGRAEARIVRTSVPVAHVDFTSMYPAIDALLGTWNVLRATTVRQHEVTERVQDLLADPGLLERCLTAELWSEIGVTLVEIEPNGDVLPTRAAYQPDSEDFGIGLNPLSYDGHLWFALPDVIAAVLLGGKTPKVLRAIAITGEGIEAGLRTVKLRGGPELDPRGSRDPFLTMIEQRARVRGDGSLSKAERDRLQLFLKITANATAYGSLARFDRRDLAKPVSVRVLGPDDEARSEPTRNPEDPGPFCFPPVACSITAGARLMLAILERLVTDAGGCYAFCDTDSMAIVSTPEGGRVPCTAPESETVTALPWRRVQAILDRFEPLNPYDPELGIEPWKVEHDSLDRQLWCYVISAKRYCLFHRDQYGAAQISCIPDADDAPDDGSASDIDSLADWSEHGLGMYLDTTSRDSERPTLDNDRRRIWIREAWDRILAEADGVTVQAPPWASAPALSRFTLSSPALANWFKGYNASRPRVDQIRPGSFGLLAHPDAAFEHGGVDGRPKVLPAAPYEQDSAKWAALDWYDRANGEPVKVTTGEARREPERFAQALGEGVVVIQTLGNVLGNYPRRPEHKSLAPGGQAAASDTRGLLRRRPIRASRVDTLLTGKEGNKLLERLTGEVSKVGDYRNDYGSRADRWTNLILPVLREMGAASLIAGGIPSATAYRILSQSQRPKRASIERTEAMAVAFAAARLEGWGVVPSGSRIVILGDYIGARRFGSKDIRRCEWCGTPMPLGKRADARFHSDQCRQQSRRAIGK